MKEQFTEMWVRLREPTKDAEAPEDISSGYRYHEGAEREDGTTGNGTSGNELRRRGGGGGGGAGAALITEESSHCQNRGGKSGRDR